MGNKKKHTQQQQQHQAAAAAEPTTASGSDRSSAGGKAGGSSSNQGSSSGGTPGSGQTYAAAASRSQGGNARDKAPARNSGNGGDPSGSNAAKGKAPARTSGNGGTPQGSSHNSFQSLASSDESENGGQSAGRVDANEAEGDSGDSLSRDVADNLRQMGAAGALDPESPIGKLIFRALEKAIAEGTEPQPWVLKLVLGSGSADDEVRITKVTPRSLASDFSAETNSPPEGVVPPTTSTPAPNSNPASLPSVPQTNTVNPVANTVNQVTVSSKPFTLKNADLPADLKLEGLPSEDVPEKMTLYRAHIRLLSPDNVSEDTINHRAIKHLALFVKGAAARSLSLMLSNSLEWRPEPQLAALRAQGARITPTSPRTWDEWVTAFTTLFAPANRISLLARDVMTLQATSDETVDEYALRVSQAYSRLLAEAERTAPPNTNSYEHAFNQALIASFENGLQPAIRVEMIREDASQSFMASKARARKHEANKLHSAASSSSTSVSSLYQTPQLEDVTARLEQRLSTLENNANQHVSSVQRGRDQANRSGGGDKRPRSQSRGRGRDSAKSKTSAQADAKSDKARGRKKDAVDTPCDFIGCMFGGNRFTHTRANCKNEARAQEQGLI